MDNTPLPDGLEALAALALRCEQATGPDRGLDALIECAFKPVRVWAGRNNDSVCPIDEPDYWGRTAEQSKAMNAECRAPVDCERRMAEFSSPIYEDATDPLQKYSAGWYSISKNPNRYLAPRYTASLDAAMSLVPTDGKGWGYRLQHHDDLVRKEWAEVWTHEDAEPGDGFFKASGHSIALALCAAALRARAASGGVK